MNATNTKLYSEFSKLSLNSIKSVQNGQTLSNLDSYLHVERPVEIMLRKKMDEVDCNGGGIVLLIGSAGDGKSHLLSRVRIDYDWDEGSFYNDATASCSPAKTAVQTLKEALVDFSDDRIDSTNRKLVLAINLGKLNAFIEDEEARQKYSKIVTATAGIFDDDDSTDEEETDKIKIVLFSKEQIFELVPGCDEVYPVQSKFLSAILEKIVSIDEANPFRKAYNQDKVNEELSSNPVVINFQLLQSPQVRDTLVRLIIEAIVRFKLIITPREFLDFVYSIMVFNGLDQYDDRTDCFKALMPSMLFSGGSNLILKAVAKLDPVVYSSTEHDRLLSELFTSYAIPQRMEREMREARVPEDMIRKVNKHYQNNGRGLDETTKFLFRIYHLLSYHSESTVYTGFIEMLPKILQQDNGALSRFYEIVGRVLPRHFGSFYEKPNAIPLNVQGGKYKLFTNLDYEPQMIVRGFEDSHPTRFPLYVNLIWKTSNDKVTLRVDYQLYSYLQELDRGRLVTSLDNEKSLAFSNFVEALAARSNKGEITIVKFDGTEKKLKNIFGNLRFV